MVVLRSQSANGGRGHLRLAWFLARRISRSSKESDLAFTIRKNLGERRHLLGVAAVLAQNYRELTCLSDRADVLSSADPRLQRCLMENSDLPDICAMKNQYNEIEDAALTTRGSELALLG